MKNTKCPIRKRCFDYGNCVNCDLGDTFSKLHKRIDRLKKQNETLTIQRNAWALTAKNLVSQWISVEERLPEIKEHHCSDTVLVCLSNGTIGFDHLEENCFGGVLFSCEKPSPFGEDEEWDERWEVTHWMLLPEAPKMKGE